LGKIDMVGMFRDHIITETEQTAEELMTELEGKLKAAFERHTA
jgi:hypothetical protein